MSYHASSNRHETIFCFAYNIASIFSLKMLQDNLAVLHIHLQPTYREAASYTPSFQRGESAPRYLWPRSLLEKYWMTITHGYTPWQECKTKVTILASFRKLCTKIFLNNQALA